MAQLAIGSDLHSLAGLVGAIVVCLLAPALLSVFFELLLHISTALGRLFGVATGLELLFDPLLPGLVTAVHFLRVTPGPLHCVLCISLDGWVVCVDDKIEV
jgi:hypothetical protein